MYLKPCTFAVLALLAVPVLADDLRPLCADRPGKETPPCIVDTGHVQFEFGALDVATTASAGVKTDNYAIGNLVARFGMTSTLEASIGWTPLTITHVHGAGQHVSDHGTGDVVFALKQSLRNPDGDGFSLAISPIFTVPTHGDRVSAGVSAPLALPLPGGLSLGFTPEIDLLPDSAGPGTHAGASVVVAVGVPVGAVNLGAELWSATDYDPAGHVHQASFDISAAWAPASQPGLQFDAGLNIGLNHNTDDVEVYLGVSRRF